MNKQTKFKQTTIGMIPEDWETDTLGNYTKLIKGISYRSEDYCSKDEGFIFINLKSVARNGGFREEGIKYYKGELREDQFVNAGDILIANTDLTQNREIIGSPLKVPNFKNDRKMCISLDLSKFDVTSKKLNSDFLYYFLMSPRARHFMIANGNGTTVVHLSTKNVPNMIIPLPSIEEQKQIAEILSSLDDKIELNNQINKNLEQIALAIFKHWFIDFEFPNENGEPYKTNGGEMVNNELGPIPKGWNVRSLNQVANFLNGLAMQKYRPENDENYLPVLKIKELKIRKTSKNSDKCSMNIDPKYIVDDGNVVFSWSGSLEVKLWCGGKAGLNQHLFKVTSANYPKWFYYYWIKHHIEDFRRIAEDKTTTMGHIKREHLSKAKVFDPGKKFFEKFDKVVNGLIKLYINNEKEIKYLSQLRDILLPKLMSGEIRVLINSKF